MAKLTLDLEANFGSLIEGVNDASKNFDKVVDASKKAKTEMNTAFSEGAKSSDSFKKNMVETISLVGLTGKELEAAQKKAMAFFSPKEVKELNKEVEKLGQGLSNGMAQAEGKAKSLRGQLSAIKNDLAKMEQEGKDNTKEYERMLIAAAKLEDQIGDTAERVRALASDTAKLDAFVQIGQGIAAGFSIAQGAAALLGEEDKDLQKTLIKLSAAQNILNGVQQIGQLITGQSAAKVLIMAKAQQFHNWVLADGNKKAMAFRATIATLGIGALIFVLYEAAKAFDLFGESADEANEKLQQTQEAQKNLQKQMSDSRIALIQDEKERAIKVREAQRDEELDALAEQFNTGLIHLDQYNEAAQLRQDLARQDIAKIEYDAAKESIEKAQEKNKRLIEASNKRKADEKKAEEDRLRMQAEFQEKSLELLNQYKDAQALTEEQQVEREAEIALDSLNNLRKELEAKGKITEEQERMLTALRLRIAEDQQKKLRELNMASSLQGLEDQEAIEMAKIDQMEKNGLTEEEFVKLKEQKKLEIEIQYAQARLKLLEQNPELNKVQIEQLKGSIETAKRELEKLGAGTGKKFDLKKALGIDGLTDDEFSKILGGLEKFAGSIKDLYSTIIDGQIEDNERLIDSLDKRIDETEKAIEDETKAHEEGAANNLELEKQKLITLQAERNRALEEQKRLAKAQLNINTVEQASSLITASANIFKSLSGIPFVGVPLAIGIIGTMFGAFIASQKQARESTKLEKGGYLTGASHAEGGIKIPGTNIEVEGKEFVINKDSTMKHRNLIEALNADDFSMLSTKDLLPILSGTGVVLKSDLPQTVAKRQAQLSHYQTGGGFRDEAAVEIRNFKKEFQNYIKDKESVTVDGDKTIIRKGNHTIIRRKA